MCPEPMSARPAHRRSGRRAASLLIALLLSACTSTGSLDPPEPEPPTPEPEPPTPAPEPVCGNGIVEGEEACDDGAASATCDMDCTPAECGDGLANHLAGEDCDDSGESATCNTDCSSAACGDGIINESAGETCEGDDAPWLCLDCQPGSCAAPTPWQQIAASLGDEPQWLPQLPTQLLATDWQEPVAELRLDRIQPQERDPSWTPDPSHCDVEPLWPGDRLEAGPLVESSDGNHCKISYRSNPTDSALFFKNRHPSGNNVPITGEPAWVRLRFPIPHEHTAVEFSWQTSWSRLFGSAPSECHENDQDDQGNCTQDYLAEGEDWSEEVPPGLFLLWGRGQDCEGWLITGPHEPAGTLTWSGPAQYTLPVPESLRSVDELVVSLLVYHQYPGGCEGDNCVATRGTHHNLAFNGATLKTEAPFDPPQLPPTEHPRLFGTDADWLASQEVFTDLPCRSAPEFHEGAGWGSATNVRNVWDNITLGGPSCLGEDPLTVAEHRDAGPYLDGSVIGDWNIARALRVLHLVRRTRACHAQGSGPCQFSLEELQPLVDALISTELDRFEEWVWSSWPFGFDLRTEPTMRFWSLFVDTLWHDLDATQHALIADRMSGHIDDFLANYHTPHWSLYNGNNWTPVLTKAALYWAITYFHEDPRAAEVVHRSLQVLWLHREFYLQDGAYLEGLLMYTQVSFASLRDANRLLLDAFGEPLQSVHWERMPAVAEWALAFTATDGMTVDFGDSWAKRGWGTFMPLYMMMHDELTGAGPAEVEPCFAREFFSNKYFDHGLRDPWSVDPSLARDWPTLVNQCPDTAPSPLGEATVLEEGGWGALRVGRPGVTATAAAGDDITLRFEQADQTYLATSAVPNSRPHTEMDFATLIWTAYGNRLLADMGYGTIGNNQYQAAPDYIPDNNPTGHNTLIIPEAEVPNEPSTNSSQIDGESGTISLQQVDGFDVILLDGSAVYGRDDPELGWLESFQRRLLTLSDGHFLVIDSFEVRSDRPDSAVQEYWHSNLLEVAPDLGDCRLHLQHVESQVLGPSELLLLPSCHTLLHGVAESAGLIVAGSLEPGTFVIDPPVTFVNRLGNTELRGKARFVPDFPLRRDLRIFALLSSTSQSSLPAADISQGACSSGICFDVTIDAQTWELSFSDAAGGYALTAISPP